MNQIEKWWVRFKLFRFVYYFKLKWWLKGKCTKCGGKSLTIMNEHICFSCSNKNSWFHSVIKIK